MGLDLLSSRFSGRIAFWCPVDIQKTMCCGDVARIRRYCWSLYEKLGSSKGGFLPKWYSDQNGAGHAQEAVDAMCEGFLEVSKAKLGV
jgi:uroporphyrinogen decarboxylase